MKRNLILIFLIVIGLCISVSGFAGSERLGGKVRYEKRSIKEFNPHYIKGMIVNVGVDANVLAVSGRMLEIVENLKMKSEIITTTFTDEKQKPIGLSDLKAGYTVEAIGYEFPNGAIVATSVQLIDKKIPKSFYLAE